MSSNFVLFSSVDELLNNNYYARPVVIYKEASPIKASSRVRDYLWTKYGRMLHISTDYLSSPQLILFDFKDKQKFDDFIVDLTEILATLQSDSNILSEADLIFLSLLNPSTLLRYLAERIKKLFENFEKKPLWEIIAHRIVLDALVPTVNETFLNEKANLLKTYLTNSQYIEHYQRMFLLEYRKSMELSLIEFKFRQLVQLKQKYSELLADNETKMLAAYLIYIKALTYVNFPEKVDVKLLNELGITLSKLKGEKIKSVSSMLKQTEFAPLEYGTINLILHDLRSGTAEYRYA